MNTPPVIQQPPQTNKRPDVVISYPFIIGWNNFFISHQLKVIQQISELQGIPFDTLLRRYVTPDTKWQERLPICLEKQQRCIARIYHHGYGGRCELKHADTSTSKLCRAHEREYHKNGKCQFGTVLPLK